MSSLVLTRSQENAIKEIRDWYYNSNQQVFRLFGYAGTGKTTLAKLACRDLSKRLVYCSFTGKAVEVLRSKGCVPSYTIHSLIYTPLGEEEKSKLGEEEKSKLGLDKGLKFILNRDALLNYELIVVDEVSMLDDGVSKDLISFGKKILVLGDPAQLPPPNDSSGFFIKGEPDFLLTEVHRQAKENPILWAATQIREGNFLDYGDYGDNLKIVKNIDSESIINSNIVLTGTNKSRAGVNVRIRELKGFEHNGVPLKDEPIICLRNNKTLGLYNGSTFNLEEDSKPSGDLSLILTIGGGFKINSPKFPFQGWLETPKNVLSSQGIFTYSYAITTHKSQGSQWPSVVLFDEWFFDTRKAWLYTAVTRAEEKLIIYRR